MGGIEYEREIIVKCSVPFDAYWLCEKEKNEKICEKKIEKRKKEMKNS